jgi:hypothetical protein
MRPTQGQVVEQGPCHYCHQAPVSGRKRKYCDEHSREASAIWKREHRRLWKAQGDKYWVSEWKSPEDRRAYFRTYMRGYRRRRRREKTTNPEGRETGWTHSH